MENYSCENCAGPVIEADKICQNCGFPHKGTRQEKLAYNGKLIRLKDLVEISDKSVKGILSFSIIFAFMAFVVLVFSLIFKENHYANALVFGAAAIVYYFLHKVGSKSSYLMVILVLLFYLGHTIFEFSNGMVIKSPVDMDESFVESRGASLVFTLIPIGYVVFRLALMIVLGKYFLTELRLKRDEKMVRFIRSTDEAGSR